ncbi:MAG: terminase small subunit [Eubacterium sp.]|nr:terminase small subunit [Eubacterium sp.]
MSRRKKVTQRDVIEGLRRLAFGDIQDAITLLFESEENILSVLPTLDLFNVSEIKKQKGGGMEIKFFDRIKALEKLREVIGSDDKQTAVSFYDALEKSAQSVRAEGEEYTYE